MEGSTVRNKVLEEIKLIPEHKLIELYDFIHYFRIGLQQSEENKDLIIQFAGCWKDMSEETFNEFLEEINNRRQQAFSGRQGNEANIG